MKWQSKWAQSFQEHDWFAWYPIQWSNNWYWLVWTKRRRECHFYECKWVYKIK